MVIMPSNWSAGLIHYLAGIYPGMLGHLYSPGGQRGPYSWLPYALDNGAFKNFDEQEWIKLLRWSLNNVEKAKWAACPDRVGDSRTTSKMWKYAKVIRSFGILPAFVVQDGHQRQDVPKDAAVVFVGGSTEWKRKTISYWCENFSRVHVGRINTYKWLCYVNDAGAESCDGTGWGRGDKNQLNGLLQFLKEYNGKCDLQMKFGFVKTFYKRRQPCPRR